MSKRDDISEYHLQHYKQSTRTWRQWYARYAESLHALRYTVVQCIIHPSWLMMLLKALYWVIKFRLTVSTRRHAYETSPTRNTDLTVREQFLLEAVSMFMQNATWEQYRVLLSVHHGIEDALFKPVSIPFTHQHIKGHWYGQDLAHSVEPAADGAAHNVLLYFHGGGFATGGSGMYPTFYMDMSKLISEHIGTTTHVLSVDYKLSHVQQCPEQVNEGLAAYDYLLNVLKVPAKRIIMGGDSAGV